MRPAGSIIKPFSLLMSALVFLTLICLIFNQLAIAQTETREERITVVLKDFSVHPNHSQANNGRLPLEAMNEGISIHELVILKTDLNPAALPRKEAKPHQRMVPEYLVNEDDVHIQTIDEIEEFSADIGQKQTVV